MCIVMPSLFVNCPTVICSPNMLFLIGETPLVNCGPGPFFYIWIQSTAIIVLCCSSQTNTILYTIRLILSLQQAGEIDNLTVTLGQSNLVVLCRFHVGAGIPGVAPHYTPSPTTFTWPSSPTGSITLVSYWGKTCCCTNHTFLLGFPTDACCTRISPCIMYFAPINEELP